MPRLQAKSFASPDDVRTMPMVRFETVALDEAQVGHCTFDPGWRWSISMGPMFGATSCPVRHLGYTMSGQLHVVMDDGESLDIGPGPSSTSRRGTTSGWSATSPGSRSSGAAAA